MPVAEVEITATAVATPTAATAATAADMVPHRRCKKYKAVFQARSASSQSVAEGQNDEDPSHTTAR